MKRLLCSALPLLVLFLNSCSQVDPARGVDFFEGTFEAALQQAEEEEKFVFVDVYTSWCGPCKVMSETVFPDHDVGEYFNARFISFKLDAEDVSMDGPRLSNTYDIGAYPTLLFLNPDGSELGRGVSGYDKDGLLGLAEDVLNQHSNNPQRLAELQARYDGGDREKDTVQEYLLVASLVLAVSYGSESYFELAQQMQSAFDEYIETHRGDVATLINSKDFRLIQGFAAGQHKSHPAVAVVVENFDSFAEIVPEFALCYFVIEANFGTVLNLAQEGDLSYKDHIALLDTEFKHAHSVIASVDPTNAILKDQIVDIAKMEYLVGTNDWDGYLADVEAKLENAKDDKEKAAIMGDAAGRLMYSGVEKFEQIGVEYATTAYNMDKTDVMNVLNYSGLLTESGQFEAALDVLEEMVKTLDPSSPNYAYQEMFELHIDYIKTLMDEQPENGADSEGNADL